jgi:hypothetical protein
VDNNGTVCGEVEVFDGLGIVEDAAGEDESEILGFPVAVGAQEGFDLANVGFVWNCEWERRAVGGPELENHRRLPRK